MTRVAIYLRVSTDGQTTENQICALEDVATARGWTVSEVYEDAGISGAKGRDQRPALDRMLKDMSRGRFDLVATWSVDRLGRSLKGLVETLGELDATGVGLFLHQQGLDTTTPSGRAMFGMLSVFAEFERAMIRERVHAGLARARRAGKRLGRPGIPQQVADAIREHAAAGMSKRAIARELGIGEATVRRTLAA